MQFSSFFFLIKNMMDETIWFERVALTYSKICLDTIKQAFMTKWYSFDLPLIVLVGIIIGMQLIVAYDSSHDCIFGYIESKKKDHECPTCGQSLSPSDVYPNVLSKSCI